MGYGTEGARRSSSLGTLYAQWGGSLVEGVLVMTSPHSICCTCTPSPTRLSVLSIPEPQVPKNQDVLHAHSSYSGSSGPLLFHGREQCPHGQGTMHMWVPATQLYAYLYVRYMWLHIHLYINVCYRALYVCTYTRIWMSMWEVSRSEYVCLVCLSACMGYVSIVNVLLMGCIYMCAFVYVYVFENMLLFHPRLAMCSPVFPAQSLD